ncbi:hypothetical protein BC828DRAFT_253932 [Blastocladiella britannica]|nr:hypothetical protein BC828DRAFT_253932 [Blastocladiella britannica]
MSGHACIVAIYICLILPCLPHSEAFTDDIHSESLRIPLHVSSKKLGNFICYPQDYFSNHMSDDENSNNTDAGPPTQPKPRALSRLTVEEMRQELSTLGLRSDGLRPTLLKRLKTHQNQQAARPTSPSSGTTTAAPTLPPHRLVSGPAPLPYQVPIPGTPEYDAAIASGGPIQLDRAASSAGPLLCVIDVEATCQEGHTFAFPNEIIELPAVLMDMDGNFVHFPPFFLVEERRTDWTCENSWPSSTRTCGPRCTRFCPSTARGSRASRRTWWTLHRCGPTRSWRSRNGCARR